MAIKINKIRAAAVLREEAEAALRSSKIDQDWQTKVQQFSELCVKGGFTTHIAFLGTAMLAKCVDGRVDLFSIKPKHYPEKNNAYSARTLCHGVLVPLSAELGFSIGVTGREPLNNQPYFRMSYLGDTTPVHGRGQEAFDYMVELVREVAALSEDKARHALRAYIAVRRAYKPIYASADDISPVTPETLLIAITTFVEANSDGGRRAQAVVAGLMDVVVGVNRVESGRINDPSRNYPGDVCVRNSSGGEWEKAIEVRDKPVSTSDILIFAQNCVKQGVRDAAVVAVSLRQLPIDRPTLATWASNHDIGLTIFTGWESFVEQALFWAGEPKPIAASLAVPAIHLRLVSVEVSPDAVEQWRAALPGREN